MFVLFDTSARIFLYFKIIIVFTFLVCLQPIRPGNSSMYLPHFELISPKNG